MAGPTTPMTQIELSINCKNLRDRDAFSKSDPMCVISMKDVVSGNYREIGRTEQIKNNLNPEFAKKISVDYFFEEQQKLRFDLYDVDSPSAKLSAHDFLGRTECSLGEIVGAPGSKVHRQLTDSSKPTCKCGTIIICADELCGSKEVAIMQWRGNKLDKKDFLGKSDPFLLFYRINDDNSQTLAHRSEVIKNNLNPLWRPFKVPLRTLCKDNRNRPIKIECYDYDNDGGHDFIGSCQTTVEQLSKGPGSTNLYDLVNPKKQSKKKGCKNSGSLQLMQFVVQTEYSFLDYIRGGTEIHFTVAVDFTASNGNPAQHSSLHYIHPYQPNQYMMALKSVGEICQDYSRNKMFPALGFGARLPPTGNVSHEFFLNFHPSDPHCYGVEGIMGAYRNAIMQVTLYGPTNFSPVINHVAKFAAAAAKDGSHYFVLLIITDGIITDFDKTKAAIVNASFLPMSIIIVGVGNDDFEAMDELDCDKGRLVAGGRVAERDIVQFVPFRNYLRNNNFAASQAALAKDVLREVPDQVTSWMRARNIVPLPPKNISTDQVPITEGQFGQGDNSNAPGTLNQGGAAPYPGGGGSNPSQGGGAPYPGGGAQPPTQQMQGMQISGGGAPYPGQQGYGTPQGQYGAPEQPYGGVPQGQGQYPQQGAPQGYGYGGQYPGMNQQQQGYNPYPAQQPGGPYPGATQGYPQQGGVSAAQPGYPQGGAQTAAYPGYPQQMGTHAANTGYPQGGGQPGANPGYPQQTSAAGGSQGYPQQQQMGYPQQNTVPEKTKAQAPSAPPNP